jgi:hypothetical protein
LVELAEAPAVKLGPGGTAGVNPAGTGVHVHINMGSTVGKTLGGAMIRSVDVEDA